MPTKVDYGRLKWFKIKACRAVRDAGAKMHRSGQSYVFIPFAQEREIVRKKQTREYRPLYPTSTVSCLPSH